MKIDMKIGMKIFNIRHLICASLALFVLCLPSCKSKKELEPSEMQERSVAQILQSIDNNSLKYNTISGSLRVSFKKDNEKNTSSAAQIKLIKDDKIQLSFQPFLGIEVFSMMFSTDSLVIVDRINKHYVAESLADIQSTAGTLFDYYSLQSLLTNKIFIPHKSSFEKSDFNAFTLEQSKYSAVLKSQRNKKQQYKFSCDHTDRIRSTNIGKENGSDYLSWDYKQFAATSDQQMFPMEMEMMVNTPKSLFSMTLSFSKLEVDKQVNIELKVPAKYKRITIDQAFEILNKLV
ncbi:hypothetical protein AwDysgo_18730 [Bacteroidales bacterium]|nr:hypothetical protein AwDysgo_18730 [Bacteroidales bacterium]